MTDIDATSNKDYNSVLSNIDTDLDVLNYIVEKDTRSNQLLLDEQEKIQTIVARESEKYERLEDEYKSEILTRHRESLLKKNNALFTQKINSIIVIITIAILLLILLTIFQKHFISFSESIFIIALRIAITSIAVIKVYLIYIEIATRDKMDYDKLHLERPTVSASLEKKREEAAEKGELLDSVAGLLCTGESCCSNETQWDENKMLCVPIAKKNKETASEEFRSIKANEPNDNYAKI